jgi:uncharacterized protein
MPLVFGGSEASYASLDEAQRITAALLGLYNEITRAVREGPPTLPADCTWHEDALTNLAPDAPVAAWSRGALRGHAWLTALWDDLLPSDVADDFAHLLLALTFFASKDVAAEYAATVHADLAALAATAREGVASAMVDYCRIGRMLEDALDATAAGEPIAGPKRSAKTGRNAACPCGSGRKYKKCCGGSA